MTIKSKSLFILLTTSSILISSTWNATTAIAADSNDLSQGFYVSGGLGIVNFNRGGHNTTFGAAIGYRDDQLRYEAEYIYGTGGFIFASHEANSFMGNVYYDFAENTIPSNRISPFIGAGLGIANVEREFIHKSSVTTLGYQGMLGIRIYATDRFTVEPQYRYFSTARETDMSNTVNIIPMVKVSYQF